MTHVDYYGRKYDIEKLIELSSGLPVLTMPISLFTHILEQPCWRDSNGELLSPLSVIDAMLTNSVNSTMRHHANAIERAETKYPVMITGGSGDDYDDYIDGCHRLASAYMRHDESILVRRIPPEMMQAARLA